MLRTRQDDVINVRTGRSGFPTIAIPVRRPLFAVGELSRVPDAAQRPSAPPEEAALLAASAAGDQAAFRKLVALHLSIAVSIARGMLGDGTEAEDIAQEAFLRLWRNAATLELGPYGLRPWLRRVVSNLAIDRIRAGRKTTVTDEVPEQPVRPVQADGLETAELKVRVAAALQTLPDRQRAALVLFHFEELSQIEVGEALGISDEAVESLLSRARRSLRTLLKDDWRSLMPDGPD
jgi:RNA polymerase sigma-70 factor, ECF subfamily